MKFSSEFARYKIISTVLILSIGASVCACNSTTTEESSETVTSSSETTITATPTPTPTSTPTPTTTEETVYIYGGRYYHEGDPAIEGKSVEAMTLSDAQNAGYTDGATMTDDEKCAYDYNMTWDMVAQGKSDAEIKEALINNGYENNETAAQFMIDWVRADYASGQRAYEAPQGTPSGTGSSTSGSTSSGSGSGGSTQPAPTETTAPAPTEPAPTQPAPTQPAPTEPAPTQTQPAPTETTPPPATPTPVPATPTPAPTVTGYELHGSAFDGDGNKISGLTFTGSSSQSCVDQYYTYCDNHGYEPGSYTVYKVWSNGKKTSA